MNTFNLEEYLLKQSEFSFKTFGPARRTQGLIAHIKKELREINEAPTDLLKWIAVVILAFDGALRAGWEPEAIIMALEKKQKTNEARLWPDWTCVPEDQAIEHHRDAIEEIE